MDIWHTCEPEKTGTEGWLGLATRELDPHKDNIVTAVSFGPSMFRALVVPGVPVACVDDLDTYGLLTGISPAQQRTKILEKFAQNYSPVIGTDEVMKYLGQTGLEAMEGADILKVAPQKYSSTVQYPSSSIAKKLKGIAQVHFADLGSPCSTATTSALTRTPIRWVSMPPCGMMCPLPSKPSSLTSENTMPPIMCSCSCSPSSVGVCAITARAQITAPVVCPL
jgi:hypothetical protein